MARERIAIGLDVGAQSVKMVCLGLAGKNIRMLNYKVKEFLPQGKDKANFIDEIIKEYKMAYGQGAAGGLLKNRQKPSLVMAGRGEQVFIRVFKLPGVAKSKLTKIIAYEAQQQVPFPIEDVVWDYQCLRLVSPEETDVVLCAVKKSAVEEFLGGFAGSVTSVVPPVIGLCNLICRQGCENMEAGTGQAVMVLDLGARTTGVIIKEKEALWFRTIPTGGAAITQAISREYGISFSESEKLKKEKGLILLDSVPGHGSTEDKRMSACIIKALTRLIGEISRSAGVYSSSFNSLGPRKIFITGGGSRLRNIKDFFNKKFRMETVDLKPGSFIKNPDPAETRKITANFPLLGTAAGLAIQALGAGRVNLNIIPRELVRQRKLVKSRAYLMVIAGLIIFMEAGVAAYNFQVANIYEAGIRKMKSENRAVEINKRNLLKIQQEMDETRTRVDLVNNVSEARNFWLQLLLELEELIPGNVWLVSIESGGETVSKKTAGIDSVSRYRDLVKPKIVLKISGKTTGTYNDVVSFTDGLNDSGYFVSNSARVVSANPPIDGVRDFSIEAETRVFSADEKI